MEHIVIDGGSNDESVAIIKKYERWFTYWVSESDHGQAHAINKGRARCAGEIFNWINSDDYLIAGALGKIAAAFPGADAVAGVVLNFDENGHQQYLVPSKLDMENLVFANQSAKWHQPGVWMRRDHVTACGGIDESYHYSFDWDLTIRYLSLFPRVVYLDDVLVHFRLHPQSKTSSSWERFMQERYRILQKLRETSPQPLVRVACEQRLRKLDWWIIVARIRGNRQRSHLVRALQLGIAACRDPRTRLTRFTLGAIRRLLSHTVPTEAEKEVPYESFD